MTNCKKNGVYWNHLVVFTLFQHTHQINAPHFVVCLRHRRSHIKIGKHALLKQLPSLLHMNGFASRLTQPIDLPPFYYFRLLSYDFVTIFIVFFPNRRWVWENYDPILSCLATNRIGKNAPKRILRITFWRFSTHNRFHFSLTPIR